jgi:hypothetical protein
VELKDGEQCTAKYRWCHGRKSPWRIRHVRRHSTDLILTQIRETQAASQFPAEVNNFQRKNAHRAADVDQPVFAMRRLRLEISRALVREAFPH